MLSLRKKNDPRITWLAELSPFRTLCTDSLRDLASSSYRTGRAAGSQLIRKGS